MTGVCRSAVSFRSPPEPTCVRLGRPALKARPLTDSNVLEAAQATPRSAARGRLEGPAEVPEGLPIGRGIAVGVPQPRFPDSFTPLDRRVRRGGCHGPPGGTLVVLGQAAFSQ